MRATTSGIGRATAGWLSCVAAAGLFFAASEARSAEGDAPEAPIEIFLRQDEHRDFQLLEDYESVVMPVVGVVSFTPRADRVILIEAISYGRAPVTFYNEDEEVIASYVFVVSTERDDPDLATVYVGGASRRFICSPRCLPDLRADAALVARGAAGGAP